MDTLQDPNTGKPEGSPSTVTVTPVLAGRFIRVDYTWSYRGEPQEGSLLVGYEPKTGEVSGHWIDTWHMGRIAMNCRGASHACGRENRHPRQVCRSARPRLGMAHRDRRQGRSPADHVREPTPGW
jgi:hypothetical protein